MAKIILASTSRFRKKVLEDNHIPITLAPTHALATDKDEEDFKKTVAHLAVGDQALAISAFKGLYTSQRMPAELILSGDQVAAVGPEQIHKPLSQKEVETQLIKLSGKVCNYYTAITLCQGGEILWQHLDKTHIAHKKHNKTQQLAYINTELQHDPKGLIGCAGSIMAESQYSALLIESITGNISSFVGIPMDALKAELKQKGILDDTV